MEAVKWAMMQSKRLLENVVDQSESYKMIEEIQQRLFNVDNTQVALNKSLNIVHAKGEKIIPDTNLVQENNFPIIAPEPIEVDPIFYLIMEELNELING